MQHCWTCLLSILFVIAIHPNLAAEVVYEDINDLMKGDAHWFNRRGARERKLQRQVTLAVGESQGASLDNVFGNSQVSLIKYPDETVVVKIFQEADTDSIIYKCACITAVALIDKNGKYMQGVSNLIFGSQSGGENPRNRTTGFEIRPEILARLRYVAHTTTVRGYRYNGPMSNDRLIQAGGTNSFVAPLKQLIEKDLLGIMADENKGIFRQPIGPYKLIRVDPVKLQQHPPAETVQEFKKRQADREKRREEIRANTPRIWRHVLKYVQLPGETQVEANVNVGHYPDRTGLLALSIRTYKPTRNLSIRGEAIGVCLGLSDQFLGKVQVQMGPGIPYSKSRDLLRPPLNLQRQAKYIAVAMNVHVEGNSERTNKLPSESIEELWDTWQKSIYPNVNKLGIKKNRQKEIHGWLIKRLR